MFRKYTTNLLFKGNERTNRHISTHSTFTDDVVLDDDNQISEQTTVETQQNVSIKQIAEQEGIYNNSKDMFRLGREYYKNNQFLETIECFQRSAELGNSKAMNALGLMYYEGVGVEKNYPRALLYFQRSASLNDSKGMLYAGIMFEKGQGTKQDYSKAMEFYKKASNLNNPKALCNLGVLYWNGDGCEKNPTIAMEYLNKSAELGEPLAKKLIKECNVADSIESVDKNLLPKQVNQKE